MPTTPANAAYPLTVDVYRANGDGADLYLGAVEYTAAEAGTVVTKSFTPAAAVTTADFIVATATDAAGRTVSSRPSLRSCR